MTVTAVTGHQDLLLTRLVLFTLYPDKALNDTRILLTGEMPGAPSRPDTHVLRGDEPEPGCPPRGPRTVPPAPSVISRLLKCVVSYARPGMLL